MNHIVRLGSRLAACAGFCRENTRMADIGTDHALLPIYLIQTGKAVSAFASDINPEPLARAAENISRYSATYPELAERITAVLGSGLENIPPSAVDDIVIAGMGGELIADILSAAPWVSDSRYRLILQPMSKHDRLREYLFGHGFEIQKETPVIDGGRCYSVMLCVYTGEIISSDLIGLHCGRVAEALSDPALRGAAARYLEMTRSRFEDMKKGSEVSGDSALSAELDTGINKITELIDI